MSESFENAVPARGEIPSVSDQAGAAPDLKKARRKKQPGMDPQRVDRLPPHSPEAEQGVLGCILLSPNECLGQCIEKLNSSDDFYDLRHQTIYAQLVEMYDERTPIDIITLQQRLKDWVLLDEIGGIPYLNSLQDSVPSAANLSYYLDIVAEKALLRRSINFCTDFVGKVYEFEGDSEQLMDELERDVTNLNSKKNEDGAKPIGDNVNEAIDTIESFYNNQGDSSALQSGYSDLDRMLMGGFKAGDMILIAARPSMGKTSLLMNILENIAVGRKIPVGMFSMEMTRSALTLRMICSRARVNFQSVTEGFMRDSDFPRMALSAGAIRSAPLYIDDTPALSILQLRARARRMVQKWKIKALGVDYLQLANSTSKRARENRQIEVSEISSGIKALAKELKIPIIVLSQMNRQFEQGVKRLPRLSDLRESGSLEQDSDVVGLLYKPQEDDAENENSEVLSDGVPTNLLIAKARNGPTGIVNFTFLKPYTRFESSVRVSNADAPKQPTQQQDNLV